MAVSSAKVVRDLNRFIDAIGERSDDIGYEIKTSVVREVIREGAIDTTDMIRAIDYHRSPVTSSGYRVRIDTSNNPAVFYDGFVEFDTKNRDGSVRSGRRFYQKGIVNSDLRPIFDSATREAFVI